MGLWFDPLAWKRGVVSDRMARPMSVPTILVQASYEMYAGHPLYFQVAWMFQRMATMRCSPVTDIGHWVRLLASTRVAFVDYVCKLQLSITRVN